MITQCPKCKRKQPTPEVYANQQVKCVDCKEAYTAVEYCNPEPKAAPVRLKHFEIAGRFFLTAIGQAIVGLFVVAICLSIIVCAIGLPDDIAGFGSIRYLLGVIAFCAVLRVSKK